MSKLKQPLVQFEPEELDATMKEADDAAADDSLEQLVTEREWWETYAECVLWTVPFGFLYSGFDFAAHAQYGADLTWRMELDRLLYAIPMVYMLNLLMYSSAIPRKLLNLGFLALHVVTGLALIHTVQKAGYLQVIRQAPALGTVWVWTTVRLDLGLATLGLLIVGFGSYVRGDQVLSI